MAAIELTFIVLSCILLIYLIAAIGFHKRMPLVTELFYLVVYAISGIFYFSPRAWNWVNESFGVQLALDLILVIAVFFLFAACVRLYQKLEKTRQDITALAREVALANAIEPKKKE